MSAAGGRRAFIAALTGLMLAFGARHWTSARAQTRSSDPTLPDADWSAIRRTIDDQRKALKSGDARKAFSFASPGIRAQFGTPETFLAMVRNGYGALIAARYVEFLEGAVIDGAVIQPLRLVGPDNSVLVALYSRAVLGWGRGFAALATVWVGAGVAYIAALLIVGGWP